MFNASLQPLYIHSSIVQFIDQAKVDVDCGTLKSMILFGHSKCQILDCTCTLSSSCWRRSGIEPPRPSKYSVVISICCYLDSRYLVELNRILETTDLGHLMLQHQRYDVAASGLPKGRKLTPERNPMPS